MAESGDRLYHPKFKSKFQDHILSDSGQGGHTSANEKAKTRTRRQETQGGTRRAEEKTREAGTTKQGKGTKGPRDPASAKKQGRRDRNTHSKQGHGPSQTDAKRKKHKP